MSKMQSCPECGAILAKHRSLPDHRRFFGMLSAAFSNWPHGHPYQPETAEHLRAYLLISAGYTDVEFIPVAEECAQNPALMAILRHAIEATHSALSRKRGYSVTRVSAAGVEIITPRSINFETLSQKDFGPIRQAVEEIIETTLNVTADQLLREKAA